MRDFRSLSEAIGCVYEQETLSSLPETDLPRDRFHIDPISYLSSVKIDLKLVYTDLNRPYY